MNFQGELQNSCSMENSFKGHQIGSSQEPTMCTVTKVGLCDEIKEGKTELPKIGLLSRFENFFF